MRAAPLWCMAALLVVCAVGVADSQQPLQEQAAILREFKALLSSPAAWDWSGDNPCDGTWEGITCNDRRDQVVALELGSFHLTGTLSGRLGELRSLLEVNLSENMLAGTLPPEWGALSDLKVLSLSHNMLGGPIPEAWGAMASLQAAYLGLNFFSGDIPGSWADLRMLNLIDMRGNAQMCHSEERSAGPTAFDKLHDKLGDRLYYTAGTVDRPCGEERTPKRFQLPRDPAVSQPNLDEQQNNSLPTTEATLAEDAPLAPPPANAPDMAPDVPSAVGAEGSPDLDRDQADVPVSSPALEPSLGPPGSPSVNTATISEQPKGTPPSPTRQSPPSPTDSPPSPPPLAADPGIPFPAPTAIAGYIPYEYYVTSSDLASYTPQLEEEYKAQLGEDIGVDPAEIGMINQYKVSIIVTGQQPEKTVQDLAKELNIFVSSITTEPLEGSTTMPAKRRRLLQDDSATDFTISLRPEDFAKVEMIVRKVKSGSPIGGNKVKGEPLVRMFSKTKIGLASQLLESQQTFPTIVPYVYNPTNLEKLLLEAGMPNDTRVTFVEGQEPQLCTDFGCPSTSVPAPTQSQTLSDSSESAVATWVWVVVGGCGVLLVIVILGAVFIFYKPRQREGVEEPLRSGDSGDSLVANSTPAQPPGPSTPSDRDLTKHD